MPASPSAAQVAALQQAMDPSLLVPDRTVAVAADGSVGVDFDLPRFGVSLVTIEPAAVAIDGGTATDGSPGSAVTAAAAMAAAVAGVASAVAATRWPTRRRRSSVWAPWSSSWSCAAGGREVRRPNVTLTYSGSDLAAAALAAAVVAVWAAVAGGAFSLLALAACEVAFLAFYLVGSLFAAWGPLAAGALFDLPLRLLMGYAAVNTALLVLAWLSPLGIVANFGLLFVGAAALFVAARPIRQRRKEDSVGLLVVGLSLAAATLWCQDSLRPISVEGNTVAFKPWIDGFYHAVHLRIFGAAHGASSIEDFRMAGVPARLYHYGAYMTPAFIRQASGIRSYAAFAGILAPMGVFFTGLGAYALVGSFWGSWPGLAAAAALLLLPDGAQQGMQNTFMSYHWLTQISPSASYGLALLALAWLFVLLGCRQGSRLQVIAGWLIAGILTFYKLHFFIASALLLLLVPPLFFRGPLGFASESCGRFLPPRCTS